jgi:hypothetical protein
MSNAQVLMQFQASGPYRPMNPEGTKPTGPCSEGDGYLVLAGSGITDAAGQWSLVVRQSGQGAVCDNMLYIVDYVSMVATPTFSPLIDALQPPRFISTASTSSGGNLTLYVRTHDQAGKPVSAPFDWHAIVSHHLE